MENQNKVEGNKMTLISGLGWFFGVVIGIVGLVQLGKNVVSGIIYLLIAVILIPPLSKSIQSKFNINLSRSVKILIILILFVISGTLSDKRAPNIPQSSSSVTTTEPSQPLTLEQQITNKINEELGDKGNNDKPRVVKVEITPYKASEIKEYGYKSNEDVKEVLIVINASENLTTNLQKATLSKEASKIFQSVFPLSPQIGDVIVWSQLPVKDQYGNVEDKTAVTYHMARPLFNKVNWDNFNYRDLTTLLNNEDKIDDRNGSTEIVKF